MTENGLETVKPENKQSELTPNGLSTASYTKEKAKGIERKLKWSVFQPWSSHSQTHTARSYQTGDPKTLLIVTVVGFCLATQLVK